MNSRIAWIVLALTLVAGAPAAHAQTTARGKEAALLMNLLQERIETERFQVQMSLKEFLEGLYDQVGRLGKELPVVVNIQAFRQANPDDNVYDTPMQFEKFPKKLPIVTLLQLAVSNIKSGDATYIIRNGHVEITTRLAGSRKVLFNETVTASFDKRPLAEVLEELATMNGVSITLDPRSKEKAATPVSAQFRNDVALQDAVRMLAEMAELKLVHLPTGLFITTPDHAQKMHKELRQIYRVDQPDAESPLAPPLPAPLRQEAGA